MKKAFCSQYTVDLWFGFSPEKYQKVQDIPEPGGLNESRPILKQAKTKS